MRFFLPQLGQLGSSGRRKLSQLQREVADAAAAAADVAHAITAPVPQQGFVPKSGPTKLFYWTKGNRTTRHEKFEQWMEETAAHPEGELAAAREGELLLQNLPPLYPNCQVLVVRASLLLTGCTGSLGTLGAGDVRLSCAMLLLFQWA